MPLVRTVMPLVRDVMLRVRALMRLVRDVMPLLATVMPLVRAVMPLALESPRYPLDVVIDDAVWRGAVVPAGYLDRLTANRSAPLALTT